MNKYFATTIVALFLPRLALGFQKTLKTFQRCHLGSKLLTSSSNPVINSVANDKVKLLKSLNIKKYRERHKLVLFEGFRQILEGISFGLAPFHVLYNSEIDIKDSQNWKDLVALSDSRSTEIVLHPATSQVIAHISDTAHSQGIVAAFQMPSIECVKDVLNSNVKSLSSKLSLLILDNLSDPGNVGTLIRSARGFGFHGVLVAEGADIWSPKVLRSSMGLNFQVPILQDSWTGIISLMRSLLPDDKVNIAYLTSNSSMGSVCDYTTVDFTLPSVIIVGNEAHGISEQGLLLAEAFKNLICIHATIPMHGKFDSFNAAVAGSIVMAELARQRRI